jgi:hypothetical protein
MKKILATAMAVVLTLTWLPNAIAVDELYEPPPQDTAPLVQQTVTLAEAATPVTVDAPAIPADAPTTDAPASPADVPTQNEPAPLITETVPIVRGTTVTPIDDGPTLRQTPPPTDETLLAERGTAGAVVEPGNEVPSGVDTDAEPTTPVKPMKEPDLTAPNTPADPTLNPDEPRTIVVTDDPQNWEAVTDSQEGEDKLGELSSGNDVINPVLRYAAPTSASSRFAINPFSIGDEGSQITSGDIAFSNLSDVRLLVAVRYYVSHSNGVDILSADELVNQFDPQNETKQAFIYAVPKNPDGYGTAADGVVLSTSDREDNTLKFVLEPQGGTCAWRFKGSVNPFADYFAGDLHITTVYKVQPVTSEFEIR